jgi:hypothetical protein
MKLITKLASAAILGIGIAGQANAALVEGANPELAGYFFDGTNSVVVDLNVLLGTGNLANQNFSIDLTGFNSSSLVFGVFATDVTSGSGRIATTLDTAAFNGYLNDNGLVASDTAGQWKASSLYANNWVNNVFNAAAQCAGATVCAGANGTTKYYGTPSYNNSLGFPATGTASAPVDFYLASTTQAGSAVSVVLQQFAGQWSLALNGASSILSYSQTGNQVPLPAGVWLLISGLTGMGALARRRPSQIATA